MIVSASPQVLTNADLGRALTPDRPTVTADQLAGLADRQFRHMEADPHADLYPSVFILGSSASAGPYGEFAPFTVTRRLDGSYPIPYPYAYDPGALAYRIGRWHRQARGGFQLGGLYQTPNGDRCDASARTFERFAELSCLKHARPVTSSVDRQVLEARDRGRADQIEAAQTPVAGELPGLIVDDMIAIEHVCAARLVAGSAVAET